MTGDAHAQLLAERRHATQIAALRAMVEVLEALEPSDVGVGGLGVHCRNAEAFAAVTAAGASTDGVRVEVADEWKVTGVDGDGKPIVALQQTASIVESNAAGYGSAVVNVWGPTDA